MTDRQRTLIGTTAGIGVGLIGLGAYRLFKRRQGKTSEPTPQQPGTPTPGYIPPSAEANARADADYDYTSDNVASAASSSTTKSGTGTPQYPNQNTLMGRDAWIQLPREFIPVQWTTAEGGKPLWARDYFGSVTVDLPGRGLTAVPYVVPYKAAYEVEHPTRAAGENREPFPDSATGVASQDDWYQIKRIYAEHFCECVYGMYRSGMTNYQHRFAPWYSKGFEASYFTVAAYEATGIYQCTFEPWKAVYLNPTYTLSTRFNLMAKQWQKAFPGIYRKQNVPMSVRAMWVAIGLEPPPVGHNADEYKPLITRGG